MYRARTRNQIIVEAVNSLAARSAIANLNPGSKARAVIEAVAQVVGNSSQDISLGEIEVLLPNATAGVLDLIAESMGIQRLPSEPARVEEGDRSFKYYVQTGTFGDINNGNDITVPTGTQLRAASDDFTTYFTQRASVTLPAAGTEVFFAADQAGIAGQSSVGPNILTRHNFTGYGDAQFNTLLVTNDKGTSARPRESDENLRFRIRAHITGQAGGNNTAVRLAALKVPGVSDVRILNGRAGLGTFDVVVYGISPVVSTQLLSRVQQAINREAPAGTVGIAVAPRLVGISLTTSLKYEADTLDSEKNAASNAAAEAIRGYITDLNPGQDFVVNQAVNLILQSSERIVDMGTPGKPFDELLVWRSSSPDSPRFSRNLVGNYNIREDEELIAEPFLSRPIQFSEA